MTEVTIPNSVTTIGNCAFASCTGLTEVTIGNSVTEIGERAFSGCTGLKWIESQAVTPPTIYSSTFSDYSVPLLAASDAYRTASNWGKFTNISALYTPTGTTFEVDGLKYEIISVNDLTCRLYAIDETVTGENVVIPETVVYKNRTFTPIEIKGVLVDGETSVKSLSISNNSSAEIPAGIIRKASLEKLTINAPITTNYIYVSNIDELVIPSTVTKVSANLHTTNNIGKITIEDSETALTTTQFKCSGTKEVYLGRNVSGSTFKNMTSLEKVVISGKVTTIEKSVFSGCTGLETIDFGENVSSIATGAFKDGAAIRTVISRNATPPTTDDTFSNDTYLDGVLYVPDASIEAYQAAAGWKNFWELQAISGNVSAIELDKASASLHETETVTITAKIKPSFANNQDVIWSASDESVAKISVDETTHICTVTAIAPGTCNIVAKSAGNAEITASCTITVLETTYPESIELSEETVTLQEGNSHAISAIISPSDVDVKTVSWSSSDEQVAIVSETGNITGITEGSCDITATTANGLEAVCHVTVIERTDPVFYEGLVYNLNKTNKTATVTYASSNPTYSGDVVIPPFIVRDGIEYTVTEIGEEAFSNTYGNNKVTQIVVPYTVTTIAKHGFLHCESLTNGLVLGCNVSSVGEGATGYTTSNHIISLNPTPPTMGKDCGWYFNVSGSIYVPKGSKSAYQSANIWSDKKSQIVELDFVSSISFGSYSARKAASLSGNTLTMEVGDKYTPAINVEPEDAYTGAIYWKSSDESVVHVSERGKITAIGAGECIIEATEVLTGASATINVKVTDSSSVVDLSTDSTEFSVENGVIKVTGNAPVHIYTVSGLTVYNGRGDARVNVTPGIYVVIVGNKAHKVAVR